MEQKDLQRIKQQFSIIGNSAQLNRGIEIAVQAALTDLSVLITGESGVGKEHFPKIIHQNSPRKHGPYFAINCGAIPEGTIDAELFGHTKGAFTDAKSERKGYFEIADGGTLFLDEVGELPLPTQARLLRVLETGEFIRMGSSEVQKTNVRVVAATNNDLLKSISEGRFREDLYYRLNTVPISVPPLRERKGDINILFRKFASDVALQYNMPPIVLDESARILLESYHWRGNIRQLKNVAEQISAVEQSRNITADILRRYLPNEEFSVRTVADQTNYDNTTTERELLYKILFDMRNDINELKRMMTEALHGGIQHSHTPAPRPAQHEVVGLLPEAKSSVRDHEDEDFVVEVVDDFPAREISKDDVQREQILEALERHNYRRKDAAKELFISERTLYRRMKALGIVNK
jgi:transcriptional regulator with PAS, ATPase and Fis domain